MGCVGRSCGHMGGWCHGAAGLSCGCITTPGQSVWGAGRAPPPRPPYTPPRAANYGTAATCVTHGSLYRPTRCVCCTCGPRYTPACEPPCMCWSRRRRPHMHELHGHILRQPQLGSLSGDQPLVAAVDAALIAGCKPNGSACDNGKKQCSPNETKPNSNAIHPRKRYNIPTNSHTPSCIKASHTHVARSQGCGRMHPVNRRVTAQNLHTESVTTRRRCGRNGYHEAPSEQRGIPLSSLRRARCGRAY